MRIAIEVAGVIVGAIATLGGAFVTIVPPLKRLLSPPSIAHEASDLAGRAMVRAAEAIVRRGVRTVSWPVFFLAFVAGLVAARVAVHTPWPAVAVLILGSGIAAARIWQVVALRRWWEWAVRQDADLSLVEELAEDAKLVWGQHTWLGRRQRRTWMRLPPGMVRSN